MYTLKSRFENGLKAMHFNAILFYKNFLITATISVKSANGNIYQQVLDCGGVRFIRKYDLDGCCLYAEAIRIFYGFNKLGNPFRYGGGGYFQSGNIDKLFV